MSVSGREDCLVLATSLVAFLVQGHGSSVARTSLESTRCLSTHTIKAHIRKTKNGTTQGQAGRATVCACVKAENRFLSNRFSLSCITHKQQPAGTLVPGYRLLGHALAFALMRHVETQQTADRFDGLMGTLTTK